MECLESGSIPVLKNYNNLDYFKNVWGHSPLPVINSWEELNELNKISEDEYNLLYETIMFWYSKFKINLSNKIEATVLNPRSDNKFKKLNSLVHFITPLHKKNNVRIVYSSIIHLVQDFNWHLIEGTNTIGEESLDCLNIDSRVHHYKMDTNFIYGHEQRNYFIKNIKCDDNDWCFFLDDDTVITQDFIETIELEKNNPVDVILFSQKKGLTELTRLYGYEGRLTLGNCDIGSFAIRYGILKDTIIPYESERNADGHYAEQIGRIPNIKIKYFPEKFTRYNALSLPFN
jgi:hypothetical protein